MWVISYKVTLLADAIRLWLASVTEFVEDDCKLRSFDSLRKIFHAQKRFTTATAIAAAFDDIRTSMQVQKTGHTCMC